MSNAIADLNRAYWILCTKRHTDAEILERLRRFEARTSIRPSARTDSSFLPFKPESSNPQKIIESRDWDLFVIDLPRINAFVLPTKEMFVYAGLIDLLEKEEPLIAAVMAHEISEHRPSPILQG